MSENYELSVIESKFPVGTVQELLAIGIHPKTVGSCSCPTVESMGCPYWDPPKGNKCMFGEVRDANNGNGAGPENRGFYVRRGPPGSKWQGFIMPCYLIMKQEADPMNQTNATGHAFSRFFKPGEVVKQVIRVRRHPEDQPDKTCAKCKKGECRKMMTQVLEMTIPEFSRPADSYAIDAFSREVSESVAAERGAALRGQNAVAPIPVDQIEDSIARQADVSRGAGGTLAERMRRGSP